MKKYVLAAALVLSSTSALADRVVSGTTGVWVDGLIGSITSSRANACASAKKSAASQAGYGVNRETVEGYTNCECDQSPDGQWSCSVDAKLVKE